MLRRVALRLSSIVCCVAISSLTLSPVALWGQGAPPKTDPPAVEIKAPAGEPAADVTKNDLTANDLNTKPAVNADQAKVRAALALPREYANAYSKNDAAAVASFWAKSGVYVDPVTGDEVQGQEKIEGAYKKIFEAEKGIALTTDVRRIDPSGEGKIILEGVAVISMPDGSSEASRYVATLVEENGKWKIERVEELDDAEPVSAYEKLSQLEWMIGNWKEESGETQILTSCKWTANRNFLRRSFTVITGDEVVLAGTQMIGYDAAIGAIRSWVFDTDGGHGEGVWSASENEAGQPVWTVKMNAVLPDGRRAAATQVITRIENTKATFQTVGKEVDGQLMPNAPAVTVVRVASDDEDANTSSGDVAVPTAGSAAPAADPVSSGSK